MKKGKMLLLLLLLFISCQPEDDLKPISLEQNNHSIRGGVIESITQLKKAPVEDLRKEVNVLGYYLPGDGGGGIFYWDPESLEEGNDGTIVECENRDVGRWKRKYSGSINVKWFGAKGDDVHDDTESIRSAIKNIGLNENGWANEKLFFPIGIYKISGNIYDSSSAPRIYIRGEAKNSTEIKFYDLSDRSETAIISGAFRSISDITFRCINKNGIAIRLKNPDGGFWGWTDIKDVDIFGSRVGLWIDAAFTCTYKNMRIEYGVDGIRIDPQDGEKEDGYVTTQNFENIFIHNNSGYTLYIAPDIKSPNISFRDCAFESNSKEKEYAVHLNYVDPIIFDNSYFEGSGGSKAFIRLAGRGTFRNCYDNTTTGIDLGNHTCLYSFESYKGTSVSKGFIGGSANTNLLIENSSSPGPLPVGASIIVLNSWFKDMYYKSYP